MNDNVREWLQVASYDIDTVHLLIKEKGHASIIIYHMHQAQEKLLKALLSLTEIEVRKSHNIDKLLSELLPHFPTLSSISQSILSIHAYLPKLRYPYGDEIVFEEAIGLLTGFENSIEELKSYFK